MAEGYDHRAINFDDPRKMVANYETSESRLGNSSHATACMKK